VDMQSHMCYMLQCFSAASVLLECCGMAIVLPSEHPTSLPPPCGFRLFLCFIPTLPLRPLCLVCVPVCLLACRLGSCAVHVLTCSLLRCA